ncbi:MAG: hypothetical protein JSV16_16595 [Candidatus Hydrogenedentota bacterium]|nr:MAG: hypothetical protein JSV16_16595 [Candidatus Hydrogenedentota bacterium]
MADALMVILGCDCDPDRPRYGGTRYDVRHSPQKWRGLGEGINSLRECLKRVEDVTDVGPKLVFSLRSDIQIKEIYGAASWSIDQYADTWRGLEEEGHELAWHPHLWRWSNEWGCWFQEARDSEWIDGCLELGFSEFSEALGEDPTTCHMGWAFHNDVTMRKLSELGLKVDFSASPGVYYEGGPGNAGTAFDNRADWLGTPQKWYHPSEADFRRPARAGESELAIIEVPKFTSSSGILKRVKDLASRTRKLSRSTPGTAAFLQITALPVLYNRIIRERLQRVEAEPFFATYFHPDELLADRPPSARGFLYSLENLRKNLIGIIEAVRKEGRDVAFVTGAEALRYIREKVKD